MAGDELGQRGRGRSQVGSQLVGIGQFDVGLEGLGERAVGGRPLALVAAYPTGR